MARSSSITLSCMLKTSSERFILFDQIGFFLVFLIADHWISIPFNFFFFEYDFVCFYSLWEFCVIIYVKWHSNGGRNKCTYFEISEYYFSIFGSNLGSRPSKDKEFYVGLRRAGVKYLFSCGRNLNLVLTLIPFRATCSPGAVIQGDSLDIWECCIIWIFLYVILNLGIFLIIYLKLEKFICNCLRQNGSCMNYQNLYLVAFQFYRYFHVEQLDMSHGFIETSYI